MHNQSTFPTALTPPQTSTTLLTRDLINQAVVISRRSPRGRIILPLHKNPESNLQRMLNVLQPGSYIQPHRHYIPPKAESVIVLQGELYNFLFDNEGSVIQIDLLSPESYSFGVDSEPGVFHTFLANSEDTVLFEVKPGPYEPHSDKDFAPWAPREGSPEVTEYMENLYRLAQQRSG